MAKSVATSGAGSAAAPARALAPHARVELSLAGSATAEMACATISDMFHVGRAEVALLRAENDVLNFLFPAELKAAGFIPLSSASLEASCTNRRITEIASAFALSDYPWQVILLPALVMRTSER